MKQIILLFVLILTIYFSIVTIQGGVYTPHSPSFPYIGTRAKNDNSKSRNRTESEQDQTN